MKYKLRAQQIVIDIPLINAEPWISIRVQRVNLDVNNVPKQTIDRWGMINRKLSDVALELYNYFEPTNSSTPLISVYGISDAIKAVSVSWIMQDYGGTIINGDVIVQK